MKTSFKKGKVRAAPQKNDHDLVNAVVSQKLKALYDDIANQEVPDRFLDLLKKLDQSSSDKSD